MMIDLNYIIDKLSHEKFFSSHPSLLLWDKPDQELLKKLTNKSDDYIYIGAKSLHQNIKIGTKFDTIMSLQSPSESCHVNSTLESVFLTPKKEIEVLKTGHTCLCVLRFESDRPEILNKLKFYNEKFDNTRHDILYLTQRPVLDRVLKLISDSRDND